MEIIVVLDRNSWSTDCEISDIGHMKWTHMANGKIIFTNQTREVGHQVG